MSESSLLSYHFFRMELGSIKVIFMERSTERVNIVSCSSSKVAGRHIEAMHKIDKLFFGEPFKQFAIRFPMVFHPCAALYPHVSAGQNVSHPHQRYSNNRLLLLRNAGTSTACRDKFKYRLTEILNQFVQSRCLQVVHGSFRLSHSGKNNFISRLGSSLSAVITASTPNRFKA